MRLRNPGGNPPSCFWYLVPQTGKRIPQYGDTSLDGCYNAVKEHLHANGYDIPVGLREQIETACCERQKSPEWCRGDGGHILHPLPDSPTFTMQLSRIAQGTKSLASWLTEGREDEGVAQARAVVCATCPQNQPVDPASCKGCSAATFNRFTQLVAGVLKGNVMQPWEEALKACRICGCDLRLKVRTRLAPIRRYMSKEQLAALPQQCWINTEVSNA